MEDRKILVIGAGPAGYAAAIRAAQLGAGVILVEEKEMGGACLNKACIPTKFLLRCVEILGCIKKAGQYGINVAEAGVNMPELQSRKNALVTRLKDGLTGVIQVNGIEIIRGCARLISGKQVIVDSGKADERIINADSIILATGSRAAALEIPCIEGVGVMPAEDILNLDYVPGSIIIIGAGVVGVEMATFLNGIGCKVSLVEIMPRILPAEDAEITAILQNALKRSGVDIHTSAAVKKVENAAKNKRLLLSVEQHEKELEAEVIAIATGYKPYTDGLGLEECGVALKDGHIEVNEHMQTTVSGIYAAGDVNGGTLLAHVAIVEGMAAAENALGMSSSIDYRAVPRCVFSLPEMAAVGLTEAEAVAGGCNINCGRFPMAANSAASILGERRGMVKIISAAEDERVLGVHIIGSGAVGMIAEAVLAIKLGAKLESIRATMHAHPTLSETLWEAALDSGDGAIHFKGK